MHIPHCSFALLVVILIACVLIKYYHHRHCIASDKLMVHHVVIHLLLWSTHHYHLPSLVLLSVCRVANVLKISLFCFCAMVRYYPCPLSCAGGGAPLQSETKPQKKIYLFFCHFFHFLIFFFLISCFFQRGLILCCLIFKKSWIFLKIQH